MSTADGGITTLELEYLRVADEREPTRAQATVPASSRSQIVDAVPGLVRRVFGVTEAAAPAGRAPVPSRNDTESPRPGSDGNLAAIETSSEPTASSGGATIAPLTWAALITGTAVLGIGLGVGMSASSSFDDLEKTPVRTMTDAKRVHGDFDSIETRATLANILMPVGGAVLGAGVVLLILDLTASDDHAASERATLDVLPLRGGAALSFHATFEGGW